MADPENKDYRPSFTGNQLEKHRLPSTHGRLIILRANCHDTSYQLSRYIEPTATIYRGNWRNHPIYAVFYMSHIFPTFVEKITALCLILTKVTTS